MNVLKTTLMPKNAGFRYKYFVVPDALYRGLLDNRALRGSALIGPFLT